MSGLLVSVTYGVVFCFDHIIVPLIVYC
jgi:hypothetical protein